MDQAQRAAVVGVIAAIGDCLRDLGTVPAGEFYARLMAMPGFAHMTAWQFNAIIDAYVGAHLVTRSANVLTWVGPKEREVRS